VRLDTVVGVIGIMNVLRMAGHSPVCMKNPTTVSTTERLTSNAVWLTNIFVGTWFLWTLQVLTASQIKTTVIKLTFMGVALSGCGYNEHHLMLIMW